MNVKEVHKFKQTIESIITIEKISEQKILLLLQDGDLTLEQCVTLGRTIKNNKLTCFSFIINQYQSKFQTLFSQIKQIIEQEQKEKYKVIQNQGFRMKTFNQMMRDFRKNPSAFFKENKIKQELMVRYSRSN